MRSTQRLFLFGASLIATQALAIDDHLIGGFPAGAMLPDGDVTVVINEVDADTEGTDTMEFVELFGAPGTPLDGLAVVLYNGSADTSYNVFDLDGFSLDGSGFFVLGNAAVANVDLVIPDNTLQSGPDAAALYMADATDFPNATPVTATNLIDAVVYDSDDGDDAGLLNVLTPGQPQVNERANGDGSGHSISRVPDGGTARETGTYVAQAPTPGASNQGAPNPSVSIAEIQGTGGVSPLAGEEVATSGIVTAVGPDGFALQTPDAEADGNPDSSEGIWVFTNAAPSVAVGDAVSVSGTVEEFFGFTRIGTPQVTIDSSGNPLPATVALGPDRPAPDQPEDTLALERLESMRVSIASGQFAGGTDAFGQTAIVLTGTRPFREPGIRFPGQVGLPVWDGNPEVFEIHVDRLGLPDAPYRAGTSFSDAIGVIGYEFGDYELWPTNYQADPLNDPPTPTPVRAAFPGELTLGGHNLFRLITTNPGYASQLAKHSLHVREVLRAPHILAVAEAGGEQALLDLAARIAADDPSLSYAAHHLPGNDLSGIDVGFLVRDGFSVSNLSQLQPTETFEFDSTTFTLHDRPPLILEGTFTSDLGRSWDMIVIAVHNRSLNGIDEDPGAGEFVRFKRSRQATRIAQAIQQLQTADPDAHIALIGDFNGFEFTDGLVDVLGQITGDLDPLGALVAGTDEVNPDFTNHTERLPATERYSFIQDGNSQMLDHVLTSATLTPLVRGVEYGRANADFPRSYVDDVTTPVRASDHDGVVAFIAPAGISVTPIAGLETGEDGSVANFQVVLESLPLGAVTIPIESIDTSEGTVSAMSLLFTSENWMVPQTVTVTGQDDDVDDGDVGFVIELGPAISTDTTYGGLDPADVSVTNSDDDDVGIIVMPTTGLVTTEAGGTDTFTVVLMSEPAADVSIEIASSAPGEGMVDPSSLTFAAATWDVPQVVTVTGVDDAIDDGDSPFNVLVGPVSSEDPSYAAADPNDVAATNLDDDSGSVIVAPTAGLMTSEAGASDSFTVVLGSQPSAEVSIDVASDDPTEGTVDTATLTFTMANWDTPRIVTVTGVDDSLPDGAVAYTIVLAAAMSADEDFAGVDPSDVSVTNSDDEVADLAISKSDDQDVFNPGDPITYVITVTNNGPAPVVGAVVQDFLPPALGSATWTCEPGPGAACTAEGVGDIDEAVDLESGASLVFALTAATDPDFLGTVANTASVAPPSEVADDEPGNNEATDRSETGGIFRDGFEEEPVELKRALEKLGQQ